MREDYNKLRNLPEFIGDFKNKKLQILIFLFLVEVFTIITFYNNFKNIFSNIYSFFVSLVVS